jgi:hypothetical protein
MKVKIYNNPPELVKVFEIVDIDYDDRHVNVRTFAGGEVFSIRFCDVELEADDIVNQDQEWLIGDKYVVGSPEWFDRIKPIEW